MLSINNYSIFLKSSAPHLREAGVVTNVTIAVYWPPQPIIIWGNEDYFFSLFIILFVTNLLIQILKIQWKTSNIPVDILPMLLRMLNLKT